MAALLARSRGRCRAAWGGVGLACGNATSGADEGPGDGNV